MGFWDDMFKGKVLTGLAIGIGASVVAPRLLPVLAEAAKPLAKAAMKGGIQIYEKGKEMAAEVSEATEDLWAEAQAELEEEHGGLPASPAEEESGGERT